MTKQTKTIIIGIAAVCAAVLVVISIRRMALAPASPLPAPAPAQVSSSSSSGASSSQQSIDTGLSLAGGTQTAPGSSLPSTAPAAPVYAGCKLSLTFGITRGNLAAAGTMQYLLTAKNLGSAACTSASISLYYADNEIFSSASPAAKDGYYWLLGDLASGGQKMIALVTTRSAALDTGDVTDEACLSADNGTDACSNSSTNVASSGSGIGSSQTATIALAALPQSPREAGVWVWTSLSDMSSADMQNIVNDASAGGFNAIYITVDQYVAITQISDPVARVAALRAYDTAVQQFLTLAAAKNISVDAEAGSRDWSEDPNRLNAPLVMTFVAAFNLSHSVKFRGIQYDIEPYLLPEYSTDEAGVLTDYVTLAQQLALQASDDNLPLTLVLPHFYDAQIAWTPQITVGGVTAYPFDQLLRALAPVQQARVIIMAYRNFASGSDGAVSLAAAEIAAADKTNVRVIVAQETGPVMPSYVTFAGLSKNALFTQIGAINAAFANDRSFSGIAVDYLDTFEQLP